MKLSALRKPTLLITTVLVACIGSVYGFHRYALYQFEKAFAAYALVAEAHDEAAYIPALPQNPLRQDLNRALSDVLSPGRSADERLSRARDGLTLLVLAEGHIDAVGEVGKDVTAAIERMHAASESLGGFNATDEMQRIVESARKRFEIVADIRGLSYRANHHTEEIFTQIVRDEGELTAAHSAALDRLLPSVEEQFDLRSNLYVELSETASVIDKDFGEFKALW